MKRDDSVYLQHILDAAARIEEYLAGIVEDKFYEQPLVQDGVIRQLEVIGEATKRLSDDLRQQHRHIPWQDIAGMRDRLIHDYLGVDLETVWLTAQEDIPTLQREVREILASL